MTFSTYNMITFRRYANVKSKLLFSQSSTTRWCLKKNPINVILLSQILDSILSLCL